jgi:hypothetical protein
MAETKYKIPSCVMPEGIFVFGYSLNSFCSFTNMKKTLILFALMLTIASSKANDTLTRAQIYNFNVGDTFDYKYTTENIDQPLYNTTYSRQVCFQKIVSANSDTISYGFGPPDETTTWWRIVTDLDSIAIFQITNIDSLCQTHYSFESTTYANIPSNSLNIGCFESGEQFRYTKGLGRTFNEQYSVGSIVGYGTNSNSEELVYFSNSTMHVGTPYNILNGSNQINYIPLPEECAIWTRTVTGTMDGNSTAGTIIEQIHTGNKIYKNGRNLVELICRIENGITNRFTPDSLIGYFYNDTVQRIVVFATDTFLSNSQTICSFNYLNGQQCSSYGVFNISTTMINGQPRTKWQCSGPGGSPNIIAGIGNLNGLIPINNIYTGCCGYSESLSSFCVCGQQLYPTNTTNNCALLTALSDIADDNDDFQLFPNPATSTLNIYINRFSDKNQLTIADITGRVIIKAIVAGKNFNLPVSFPSGLYFVTLSNGQQSATRKLVVSK